MSTAADIPANLPTVESVVLPKPEAAPTPEFPTVDEATVEYVDIADLDDSPADELSLEMKELEDRAHAHNVLLSSDAMRHFITLYRDDVQRINFLDRIIADARVTYPSEDGWVVLNLSRMHELTKAAAVRNGQTPKESVTIAKTPLGAGSLAEAIVAGDVNAAYRLVEHRPMVALADAASDLDAIYREKLGMEVESNQVSELLKQTVDQLDRPTLEGVIKALTSAVDGAYSDEHAAVKIAIMKAVDIVHGK